MAKKRLPLVINAVDFSEFVNRTGYTVGYENRLGPNGGFMTDGTETVDLRSRKAVIQWTLNDLTSDKLALLMDVCSEAAVAVKFFDPKINATRSGMFTPSISAGRCNNITADRIWFVGQILTLREK